MDEDVKAENTIEVSLSITSDPTSSVFRPNTTEDVFICSDLNVRVKHEGSSIQRSDQQIKLETADIKFGITSDGHEVYIKLESLESEELQIKNEIEEQSSVDEPIEKCTQFKYFCCGLCNSKFTYKATLRQHMKIHTGDKPFKCSECDYKCVQKSNLSTHMVDKPFKCGECASRCTRKSHLSRHIKSHTGEKPFKCILCEYVCIQKCSLKQHMKTHF